jgi:hypothetical protein
MSRGLWRTFKAFNLRHSRRQRVNGVSPAAEKLTQGEMNGSSGHALAHVYATTRQEKYAKILLSRIASRKPAPAYDIAVVKEALGQHNQALRSLVAAKSEYDGQLMELYNDPPMDLLRQLTSKQTLWELLRWLASSEVP